MSFLPAEQLFLLPQHLIEAPSLARHAPATQHRRQSNSWSARSSSSLKALTQQPVLGPRLLLSSFAGATLALREARRQRCRGWAKGQRRLRLAAAPEEKQQQEQVAQDLVPGAVEFEEDVAGRARLQYKEEGWKVWTWSDGPASRLGPLECHYIAAGPPDGPPVVLVHGFGANAYHWRYQVPALAAQGFRVYALDLLGYGWGPRLVLKYTGEVWAAQISSFLRQVVGGPAVLIGNSIGAFVSLLTAALSPEQVSGLVMLNAAGRWERNPELAPQQPLNRVVAEVAEKAEPGPIQWVFQQVQRAIATWAFFTTKAQIGTILESVYENDDMVDQPLITSISTPADHPDALDAFGELIQAGRRTKMSVFEALDACPQTLPFLLLWGQTDPWMRPERADAILAECAERGLTCDFVPLVAGHCPHDDVPEEVNRELLSWLNKLPALSTPPRGEVVAA